MSFSVHPLGRGGIGEVGVPALDLCCLGGVLEPDRDRKEGRRRRKPIGELTTGSCGDRCRGCGAGGNRRRALTAGGQYHNGRLRDGRAYEYQEPGCHYRGQSKERPWPPRHSHLTIDASGRTGSTRRSSRLSATVHPPFTGIVRLAQWTMPRRSCCLSGDSTGHLGNGAGRRRELCPSVSGRLPTVPGCARTVSTGLEAARRLLVARPILRSQRVRVAG